MTDAEKLDAIIAWLHRNATADKDLNTKAAFVEAHNAALKIKNAKTRDDL